MNRAHVIEYMATLELLVLTRARPYLKRLATPSVLREFVAEIEQELLLIVQTIGVPVPRRVRVDVNASGAVSLVLIDHSGEPLLTVEDFEAFVSGRPAVNANDAERVVRPLVRCKHRKTPGDGGIVDGCGWQGELPDDWRCPECGVAGLLRAVTATAAEREIARTYWRGDLATRC